MTVTVDPAEFRFVHFDASVIAQAGAEALDRLGLTCDLHVEVDETTPLARLRTTIDGDTVSVRAESGAFEDTRRPRHQSATATATSLGRVLIRARDRMSGGFDEAPADTDLTLAQVAAWDAYAMGRLERLGWAVHQQRYRYNFRNRHGFSDASDAAFDALWAADALTWHALDDVSRRAGAAEPAPASRRA